MAKTLDQKYAFIELRSQGFSFDKIAAALDISKPTLIKWVKEEDTMLSIDNQRSIYLDELQEQLQMKRKHRIQRLALMQLKFDEELSKRDFSELSTDKLAMLTIQTSKALKAEEQKCTVTVTRDRFQASELEEVATHTL